MEDDSLDLFDLVGDVLGEEVEANEQSVADDDGYEPVKKEEGEEEDSNEQAEDDEPETEDQEEEQEENLGIRFKKAKAKNEKLQSELEELRERLKALESKDAKQGEPKKEDLKDIDLLKQEISNLKKDKIRQEWKLQEDIFYSEHPELAKERAKHSRKFERYFVENPEIAKAAMNGKVALEQVHVLMGGNPRTVINDPTKVFGTAGVNVSNPRVTQKEKTAYETALEILDKKEINRDEFDFARDALLEADMDFFINSAR
jgi:predicted RNase H-like nuclease (RuvC/YqgF family)